MTNDQQDFAEHELRLAGNEDPSTEELEDFFVAYEQCKANKKRIKDLEANYKLILEEGYLHTDNVTYYANDKAANDMVKALTLFGIDSEEPLPLIDMAGNIHLLYINEFKALASTIGRYIYSLRSQLWEDINTL